MATSGNPSLGNMKGMGELWARLRFLFLAIVVYRIGTHIPLPGIDPDRLAQLFNQNQGTILGMFNMSSAGALERMSILALGSIPMCLWLGKAQRIPNWLAQAGIGGYILLIGGMIADQIGQTDLSLYLLIPGALFEAVFGILLIAGRVGRPAAKAAAPLSGTQ